jgi:K+-sensing histidine kinase KdpD
MVLGGIDQALQMELLSLPGVVAAAHELKSPLVLVRQLALELQMGELGIGEQKTSYERIKLTADRSLRLVERLTRAVRLDEMLIQSEPINISELYDNIAHELTPLARQFNQEIVIKSKSNLSVVACRDLLCDLILSLCDNALQHNPDSGHIELKANRLSDDNVNLSVRDFGPQISLNTFRLMSQRVSDSKPQSVASRPRSSGLGLLIASNFARHMDSSLRVIRHRDSGLTFGLDLPASKQLSFGFL